MRSLMLRYNVLQVPSRVNAVVLLVGVVTSTGTGDKGTIVSFFLLHQLTLCCYIVCTGTAVLYYQVPGIYGIKVREQHYRLPRLV